MGESSQTCRWVCRFFSPEWNDNVDSTFRSQSSSSNWAYRQRRLWPTLVLVEMSQIKIVLIETVRNSLKWFEMFPSKPTSRLQPFTGSFQRGPHNLWRNKEVLELREIKKTCFADGLRKSRGFQTTNLSRPDKFSPTTMHLKFERLVRISEEFTQVGFRGIHLSGS